MQMGPRLQRLLGTVIFAATLAWGCAPAQTAEKSPLHAVKHVIDGDTIVLDDGEHVRLVGIQAPEIAHKDSPGQPYGPEATEALKKLIGQSRIRVEPAAEPRDRHGRLLAYLYPEKGDMLQLAMVKSGAAMVYSFPNNTAHISEFLKAEAAARAAGKGLWQLPAYRPLTAETAGQGDGQYRVVEGVIRHVAKVKGHWYLNFGEDWKTDFTIFIDRKNVKRFSSSDLHPQDWEGRRIRIHGWIFPKNGPMIELTHPQQMELLVSDTPTR